MMRKLMMLISAVILLAVAAGCAGTDKVVETRYDKTVRTTSEQVID